MEAHERAIIVQSDGTLLVDVHAPGYAAAREALSVFAHLEKAPEHLHTYRITKVSLWNAAAAGATPEEVLGTLEAHSRYPVPEHVAAQIAEQMGRWGALVLERGESPETLVLTVTQSRVEQALARYSALAALLRLVGDGRFELAYAHRGEVKRLLARIGYPVVDRAGFTPGAPLEVALRETTRGGRPFRLRPYQQAAVDAFLAGGRGDGMGGHGVVVLPCGGGKTIVAIAVLARLGMRTLVLATGTTAVRQWIAEILDKTTLSESAVGEYSGQRKEIRPVTVATYQIATRKAHRSLFDAEDWGLVVYDEVHMLPAPLFSTTADLQARRRLGLTATLVREDGKEAEVFSLIGPKRYEVPWRQLEEGGFVAVAECVEIRVPPSDALLSRVLLASGQDRYRIPAEYHVKDRVVETLVRRHRGERILVIGQYLDQLRRIAGRLGAPLLTGETPQDARDRLYAEFRAGTVPVLVVSRVANFSVDLPDASVLVQVSGLFGSRQEEAQRLGRILRPKSDGRPARFYTVVTADTADQDYALRRQRFLTEQGYDYRIETWKASGRGRAAGTEASFG